MKDENGRAVATGKSKAKRGKMAGGKNAGAFRRKVTEWFGRNARDLPWRRTTDPYAILVSEMMCQQTQAGTAAPYFERWMRRFPDCGTLAAATEREVMSMWQGLGYYSRARHLHAAAKAVGSGEFPREIEGIRALPGVGRYTAGAIAAFAYDEPVALVDGNIARVLARVFAVREPMDTAAGSARVWAEAERLQPVKVGGRAFNGGLMEIGALLCTPRAPRCGACPVAKFCAARSGGCQEELPVKTRARRRTVMVEEQCALITRKGKEVLLEHQRGRRWSGLWKLPVVEETPAHEPELEIEYRFTHHKVTLRVHRLGAPRGKKEGWEWHAIAGLKEVPLAAGHRRAIERLIGKR